MDITCNCEFCRNARRNSGDIYAQIADMRSDLATMDSVVSSLIRRVETLESGIARTEKTKKREGLS